MGEQGKTARGSARRVGAWVAMALGAAALGGCTIAAPGGGGSTVVSRAGPLDGTWGDVGGVGTATLQNGRFVNVANDTGNRVAEGTYTYTSRDSIALDFFSLVRQTRVRANCVLANPSTLNCTNDAGQQFQLVRRSGIT